MIIVEEAPIEVFSFKTFRKVTHLNTFEHYEGFGRKGIYNTARTDCSSKRVIGAIQL